MSTATTFFTNGTATLSLSPVAVNPMSELGERHDLDYTNTIDDITTREDKCDTEEEFGGAETDDNADDGTEAMVGVEEKVSATQSPIPPPPPRRSQRKRNRKSQNERTNPQQAKRKKGGARLVLNKNAMTNGQNRNERTCLPDAVSVLVPAHQKELAHAAMIAAMPEVGDTAVGDVNKALDPHGMTLVPVSEQYLKKGGAPFHLLQERDCKLVVNAKLTDPEGDTISHFVAWDGQYITDPHYRLRSKVNDTTDRTDKEKSKLAFAKLFPSTEFASWQITSVYQLTN
jgi:hypothetical protein